MARVSARRKLVPRARPGFAWAVLVFGAVGCAGMGGAREDAGRSYGTFQRSSAEAVERASNGSVAEAKTEVDSAVATADELAAMSDDGHGDEQGPSDFAAADSSPVAPTVAAMRDAGELVRRGQTEGARLVLLIAARQKPVDVPLCVALARVNESLARWQEAAEWYAAADAQFPAEAAAERRWDRQRARCLSRGGNAEAARQVWKGCVDPTDRRVGLGELYEFADACLKSDDAETAQQILDQISERTSGGLHEVELLRAACALRRGDAEAAVEVATAALEAWPGDERLIELVRMAAPADEPAEEPEAAPPEPPPAADAEPSVESEEVDPLPLDELKLPARTTAPDR